MTNKEKSDSLDKACLLYRDRSGNGFNIESVDIWGIYRTQHDAQQAMKKLHQKDATLANELKCKGLSSLICDSNSLIETHVI